jgi:hypothetical protein
MNHLKSLAIFISAALLLIVSSYNPVYAAWSNDPSVNTVVSTATGDQNDQRINLSSDGGTIVVWADYRSGTADIYAQKFDANGNALWTANGVAVCTYTNDQENPRLVSDDNGGAIIVWQDYRSGANYDIYAQRLDANGNALWTANGVAVSSASRSQETPTIVRDGSGGAIIAWEDFRYGLTYGWDIYAQRIDSNGNALWTSGGVAVSSASGGQVSPEMIGDSNGVTIIVWKDNRTTNQELYAQKLNANGAPQWTADGILVSSATGYKERQRIVSDDNGGVIVAWQNDTDIYAQKLDSSGSPQWTASGVVVCNAEKSQIKLALTPLSGGAVITWQDYRNGSNYDIYAQRLDSNGSALWTANGVAVATGSYEHYNPIVRSDDYNRVIIAWEDRRSGTGFSIYAQRLDANGNALWNSTGVAATTSNKVDSTYWPQFRIEDSGKGAVIAWTDFRSGESNANIYTQKIQSNGTLPCPNGPIKIQGTSNYYTTIQTAYDAADGQTVQIESIEFTEDLALNSGKSVKLQGGYYGCGFSASSRYTTVHGTVTIGSGTVTVDKILIM